MIESGGNEPTNRMAVCDQEGLIGIYDINNKDGEPSFNFMNKCHSHDIKSILYVPEENLLVSGSNEDKK